MSQGATVLVVEDDEDDFFFTRRVLQRQTPGRIIHVDNGRAAIDYLRGVGPYSDRQIYPWPDVVLLDLKMDHVGGLEVLAAIRAQPPSPLPRIVVVTGSNEPKDRELVKNSGVASGYVVKPLTTEHLPAIFGEESRLGLSPGEMPSRSGV
jgi:CheY-like chemotaxis protein